MEAPVLTREEQKAALAKKNKKKLVKVVLSLPQGLQVGPQIANDLEAINLKNILERLLPSARLPNTKYKSKDTTQVTEEEKTKAETAIMKRKQLALGINSLSKNIIKGLISAALMASDVAPQFLIKHLNVLCSNKCIPYLQINNLREITNNCLGFPCVALGFKTNSDFSDVVEEIKAILENKKISENCDNVEPKKTDNESESESVDDESESGVTDDESVSEHKKNKAENEEPPFTYLYRSSSKERVFDPDKQNDKREDGFILIDKCEDIKTENVSGISAHLVKKSKELVKSNNSGLNKDCEIKKKKKKSKESVESGESDSDEEIPKKKQKKNRFSNRKKGEGKKKPKYYDVNLIKVSSNPNRIARKRKVQ